MLSSGTAVRAGAVEARAARSSPRYCESSPSLQLFYGYANFRQALKGQYCICICNVI